MVFSKKSVFIIAMAGLLICTSAWGAEADKLKSYDDLAPDIAKEVICPDGMLRLVASAEEDIKGTPYAKARSIAQRIATLRAKAMLADYINGSEFEQTIVVTDAMKSQEGSAFYTQDLIAEYIAKMRTMALRGIEVLNIKEYPEQKTIKIIVGLSDISRQTADKYKGILNNPNIIVPDKNVSGEKAPPTSRRNYN